MSQQNEQTRQQTNLELNEGTEEEYHDIDDEQRSLGVLRLALKNIQICVKRITGFTDKSVQNFKNKLNKNEIESLKNFGIDTSDHKEWMKQVSRASENCTNHEIQELALSVFDLVCNVMEDIPQELEVWRTNEEEVENINENTSSKLTPTNNTQQVSSQNSTTNPTSSNTDTEINKTVDLSLKNNDLTILINQISKNYKQLRLETLRDSSQDVITWFETFEFQTPKWSDEERAETVRTWFEDYAMEKYRQMKSNKLSYQAIKKYMINCLREHKDKDLLLTFYGAKQEHGESVEKFSFRLVRYLNEADGIEKTVMKSKLWSVFSEGVNTDIKQILVSNTSKDFDQLVKLAKQIEKCQKEKLVENQINSVSESVNSLNIRKEPVQTKQSIPKDTNLQCSLCDKNNHSTENCFSLQKAKSLLKNNSSGSNQRKFSNTRFRTTTLTRPIDKCSFCQKQGHLFKDCRARTGKCFKCGSTEHRAIDCRRQNLN